MPSSAPSLSSIYTLSLHDALPICSDLGSQRSDGAALAGGTPVSRGASSRMRTRSEEHTSELQSLRHLVCRLLLLLSARSTLFPYTTLFRSVRILAPNEVMARRWREELLFHVAPLQECAPALPVSRNRVKDGTAKKLSAGSIQVVKHSYASKFKNLACDLLIVDEAHRAKGEHTAFSGALERQKKSAKRVLILTATPFSIRLEEMLHMRSEEHTSELQSLRH